MCLGAWGVWLGTLWRAYKSGIIMRNSQGLSRSTLDTVSDVHPQTGVETKLESSQFRIKKQSLIITPDLSSPNHMEPLEKSFKDVSSARGTVRLLWES